MAILTSQAAGMTGAAITFAAADIGTDFYVPIDGDRAFFWIKNGGGGSITLTVTVAGTSFAGQAHADIPIVIGAGAERMVGPLLNEMAGPDTLGTIGFAYSGVTSVTVAVVRLEVPSAYPSLL